MNIVSKMVKRKKTEQTTNKYIYHIDFISLKLLVRFSRKKKMKQQKTKQTNKK